MPNESANFNEVLQVIVDVPAFKQSLDEIVKLYEDFKKSIEGQDIANVVNVSSFKNIQDALEDIKKTVIDTTEAEAQAFRELGIEVSAVAEQIAGSTGKINKEREEALTQTKAAPPPREVDGEQLVKTSGQEEFFRTIEIEQEGITNKAAADAEKLAAQKEALIERTFRLESEASNKLDLQRQKAIQKEAADRERAAQQQIKAQEAANKKTLFGNLGEDLTQVVKYLVLWQAVLVAVEAVGTVLASPFVALKQGITYLEETAKAADDLSGVIQANVKFAGDFTTQLAKSREGAEEVVKAFQNISIKDNLKTEDLDRVFKAFAQAGGAEVAPSLQKMVDITELFSLALKASGASAASLRSLVADIPKLLNGTVAPTSKLLEVLHLSSEEAKTLIANAKEQGNLYEQLAPKLAPYLTATQQAALHNAELAASLELTKQRLEGILATPVFETINGYLKSILEYLNQNKERIEEIARALGNLANETLKELVTLVGTLGISFKGVALTVASISDFLANSVNELNLLVNLSKAFVSPAQKDRKFGGDPYADSIAQFKTEQTRLAGLKKATEDAINGKSGFVGPLPPSTLDDRISKGQISPSLTKDKKVKSLAAEDREDFQDEVAKIKIVYEDLKEAIDESLKAKTLSHREASVQVIKALEDERVAYSKAASDYRDKVQNDTTIKEEDKPRLYKQSFRGEDDNNRTIGKQKSAAIQASNAEEAAIRAEGARATLALADQTRNGLLAIYRQEFQDGVLSARELLDAEKTASEEAFNAKLSSLKSQQESISDKTVEYAKLEGEKQILLQESANSHDTFALRSIALDEEIARKKRQFALEILQTTSEQNILELQTNQIANDSRTRLEEVFSIRQREIDAKREEIQVELALAQAKQRGGDAAKALSIELSRNTTETLQNIAAQVSAIRGSSDPTGVKGIKINDVRRTQISGAQNDVNQAQAALDTATSNGPKSDNFDDLTKFNREVDALTQALSAAKDKLNGVTAELQTQDLGDALGTFEQKLLGFDLGDALSNAQGGLEKFAVGAEAVAGAFTSINAATQAYSRGQKQGGTLGGIGALLDSGPVKGLAALGGPIVSGIVSGISGALSFVGGLFTAQAKKIADGIKNDFDVTVRALQQGSATISQTLAAVTQERSDAITKLSGTKGGKDQLKTLLPSLDDEIASLKQQEKDIVLGFEEALGSLTLKTNSSNDALSTTYTNWVAINKQVQDYINAGGDAAKASEFLSLSLGDIQKQNQQTLNDGQQQAIQDAIHLNDLLVQKVNLERQYNQQIFALQNSDSLERANNGIISRAQQLQEQQFNNQQQLVNLNNEISLTTQKVSSERQIFSIATDINQLHKDDNFLTLTALDLQLAKYASIKDILASITVGANGLNSLNTGVFANQGVSVGQINVNIQTPQGTIVDGTTGQAIGTSVYNELQILARLGTT